MKIAKNIPIPEGGKGRPLVYPFGNMEIGDSVYVDGRKKASIQAACRGYGKRHNMRFTTRAEKSGLRVWRVE